MLITIVPEKFTKGKEYSFKQIEMFAHEWNYELQELGGSTIGRAFIVLSHNDIDCNITFVLTGYNSSLGNLYECVYTDLK